jgi:hypothetical protein
MFISSFRVAVFFPIARQQTGLPDKERRRLLYDGEIQLGK